MSISNNYVPVKQLGNGVTTQFSGNWKVLNASYLRVYLESVSTGIQTLQTLGANYTLVFNDAGFTVTMNVAPTSANYVVIGRSVDLTQTDPYRTSKGFQGRTIEDSFDKLTAIEQDQNDQIGRSLKFKLGSSAAGYQIDDPINGRSLKWDVPNQRIVNSTTDIDTVAAQVAADAATASAAAGTATGAAGTATTQAGIATAAAAQAQAIADSMAFRDVVFVTFANSPVTINQASNGKLYSVDTSGGNVVFNFPLIAGLALPFVVGIKKATGDTNSITCNRSGTDTFNDNVSTTKVISSVGGSTFYPDIDSTPDRWTTADFGATSGEDKRQVFTGGVDYTGGVTTTLTLTNLPVAPTSAGLDIVFDGVTQISSEWSYNPTTGMITFTSAIPVGVLKVEARWGTSLAVGVTADGSVTYLKLSSGVFATAAQMNSGAANLIVNAVGFNTFVDTYQPRKVASFTPAGGSTDVVIPVTFRSGYNYRIQVDNLQVGANNTVLQLLMSNDNGATYLNSASAYTARRIYGTTGVAGDATAATVANLTGYGMLASIGLSGELLLLNPAQGGKRPMGRFDYLMTESGSSLANGLTHFWTNANFTCNKIKLSSSTNFSNVGRITVYEEPAV